MTHRLGMFLLLCLLAASAACKTGAAGKVPTSLPVQTFQPPDKDELFPDDDSTQDSASDGAAGEGD
jgi:hypothetical protein